MNQTELFAATHTKFTFPIVSEADLNQFILSHSIQWHTDAGHGWLQAPLQLVKSLKLKITQYSYMNAEFAYLEEDCDAGTFLRAIGVIGGSDEVKQAFRTGVRDSYTVNSFVRNLKRYR